MKAYGEQLLEVIGRSRPLLRTDVEAYEPKLSDIVRNSSFLVIGGAGTIGQAVVRELFKRKPKKLYVLDISENNMTELVRDIRSTLGYIDGDFRTFILDCGSDIFTSFMEKEAADGGFDYVLNLSALKHVRSEKDPYTLMRLVEVNVLNTKKTLDAAADRGAEKYFSVSTDKAANPVNMMGASKRIMEAVLHYGLSRIDTSTARFANVAFSDGSLLHGFNQRMLKRQPISAPNDVRRYFVTQEESGQLCMLAALLGGSGEAFFPKQSDELHLTTFSSIAERYLTWRGYEPCLCSSEDEARDRAEELIVRKKWPCYFFETDTTGEKDYEEFFTDFEETDLDRFEALGVVTKSQFPSEELLDSFLSGIDALRKSGRWTKEDILSLFVPLIGNFSHLETGKYLDGRM
jgi:FlaA1/EpsC-like NDP-sugar epimerase